MSDTTVAISVAGNALTPDQRNRVRSVDILEAAGAQTQLSMVVEATVDGRSNWTTPLDPLVTAFAPFAVRLRRDGDEVVVPGRATSAAWSLRAGGQSTLTIAGLDASADLDQVEHDKTWFGHTDTQIARELLGPSASITDTRQDSSTAAPVLQRGTDWALLRKLAERNNFDVYFQYEGSSARGVFAPIDHTATPSASIDLGYGALGGTAAVQVQLAAGQRVVVTHPLTSGEGDQEITENAGTDKPMGTMSLGGAVTVLRYANDAPGTQSPEDLARVQAESSAFAAELSVTLVAPSMPLVRARTTVRVAGLGSTISGRWLVKSVRHTISPAGHTQALTLTRNALGDDTTRGAAVQGATSGQAGALAAQAGAL